MTPPERPAPDASAGLAPGGGPSFFRDWSWGLRPLGAIALGNLCGWGAWRLGVWALPAMWARLTPQSSVLVLILMTAISAIVMAGPPVLVGALAAGLAGRAHIGVGLLSGLWSLMLIRTVPAGLPIAPGLWFASTVLVLFSGGMGGWTMRFGGGRPSAPAPEGDPT